MAEYEPSGNYIIRLSLPEVIEMGRAVDIPAVGWRYYNDVYHPRLINRPAASGTEWAMFRAGNLFQDVLCRMRLMPFGGLTCAIFKAPPTYALAAGLARRGIRLRRLPRHPYLGDAAARVRGA